MRELEHLLPTLEPPPGGLTRLRRHVRSARRPPWRQPRWAWAGVLVVVAVVAAAWLPPTISRWQQTDRIATALRAAMHPPLPASGIRVANGGAIELPSGQDNVRLYLVQSQ